MQVFTSRGGGVLHDEIFGGSAGLPCQAGLRPHSRNCSWQFVRRLTTKELVFPRFVTLRNAAVNVKKVKRSSRKVLRSCTLWRVSCWQTILQPRVTPAFFLSLLWSGISRTKRPSAVRLQVFRASGLAR